MKKSVVIKWYRVERWCYIHRLKIIATVLYRAMQLLFGCTIPPSAVLEEGVDIPHFHGIVIHHKSVVGSGTLIYQNVTLGGRNGQGGPTIGNNCIIGCGACVLGEIHIGNNVKIGANAVVLENIPDNCTVIGIPGRISKRVETKSELR